MNRKNFLFFPFLAILMLTTSSSIDAMALNKINPAQTPLAIDLHDTFMTSYYLPVMTGFAHLLWHFPAKLQLAKLTFSLFPLLKFVKEIQKTGATGEETLQKLQEEYPVFAIKFSSDYNDKDPETKLATVQLTLAEQINKMITLRQYYPNKELAEILQELKDKGHPIFAVSNIGDKAFSYLKEAHPEFNIFEDKFIPSDAQKFINKNREKFHAETDLNVKPINKNNPRFYSALGYWLEQKGIRGTGYFLDDRKDYLEAAEESNEDKNNPRIVGLHFTSAADMKKQLISQGLLSGAQSPKGGTAEAY